MAGEQPFRRTNPNQDGGGLRAATGLALLFFIVAIIVIGVITLAVLKGTDDPDGPLLGAIIATIFVVGVSIEIGRDRSAGKDRKDYLGNSQATTDAAAHLDNTSGIWAGEAGGQELQASVEDRAAVLGPPGAGKTAFLVAQLLKWAESGQPLICLDAKPEIHAITKDKLRKLGYRVLVYNPTAGGGTDRYNPIDDLEGPEAIGEIAAALVPATAAEDAVFNESARDFLDALISHLRAIKDHVSLVDVRQMLADADRYQDLLRELRASPDPDAREIAAALMTTAANERLLGSIFATMRANLRFLRYPKIRASLEASDFSLEDFGNERPVALFLQFEERHRETTARLLAALVAHLMRYLISYDKRPPVLLLLDEIGTVPPIPGLIEKLNTIRSRNLPTWTYWQNIEQMQRYGAKADEGPNLILGACDFQMVFRLNDNASAEWMSRRIGVVDVVTRAASRSSGQHGSITTTTSVVTEPKIFPHELQELGTHQVVCAYRGNTWRGRATPYFAMWPEFRRGGTTSDAA